MERIELMRLKTIWRQGEEKLSFSGQRA